MIGLNTSSTLAAHPGEFVLSLGAGVHEGLGDDGQRGVHYFSHMNVKDEMRVFQNVYPEPERQTEETNTQRHILFFIFLQMHSY